MGAGASCVNLSGLSAADVADLVGRIGGPYEKYKHAFIENEVDGHMLIGLDKEVSCTTGAFCRLNCYFLSIRGMLCYIICVVLNRVSLKCSQTLV